MAKASQGVAVEQSLEVSRVSLEQTLDKMVEVFKSCPKSTIKRRLKKKAKDLKWPTLQVKI